MTIIDKEYDEYINMVEKASQFPNYERNLIDDLPC